MRSGARPKASRARRQRIGVVAVALRRRGCARPAAAPSACGPCRAVTTLRRRPVSSVSCAAFHWPICACMSNSECTTHGVCGLELEGALGVGQRLGLVAARAAPGAIRPRRPRKAICSSSSMALEGAVGAVAIAGELGGLRRQQQRERRLGEKLLGLAGVLLRLGAVAGGDRGQPLRQRAIAAPPRGSRPSLRAARRARRRSSGRAATRRCRARIRHDDARPAARRRWCRDASRCHSAVTVPGRSASQTAPSIAAAAAMTNQMSVRRMVIGSARRAQQGDGMGRELVDAALGGEMGLGPRQPGRRGLGGLRPAATSPARPPWRGRRHRGRPRRARAWLRPNRPGIVADAAQRDQASQLAQQPLAERIVGEVVGQGRLGDRRELGGEARRARRRRSAA